MTFLQELFSNRYGYEEQENDEDDTFPGDDNDDQDEEDFSNEYDDQEDEGFPGDDDQKQTSNEDDLPGDEEDSDWNDEGDLPGDEDQDAEEDKEQIEDVVNKATENPNKQGAIRTVPGAHLVYKREQKDGTYEELWTYRNDDMKNALQLRRDIIAGTDIPVNKSTSDDSKQSYTIWTSGNVEMLNIIGLPN